MKNSTVQKGYYSTQTSHKKDNQNHPGSSQTSIGLAMDKYEESQKNKEDAKALASLKDGNRLNSTGTDDDLAVDIQDAIGRDESLSLVADSIFVTVEREIVTLEGGVFSQEERMTAGDIATALAGENFVNNCLSVSNSVNFRY